MRYLLKYIAVFTFICIITNSQQNVSAEDYDDVSVYYLPMFSPISGIGEGTVHGYVEHRFRVQNRSTSEVKKVEIDITQAGYPSGGIVNAIGFVEVPAGQSAVLTILQPAVAMGMGGALEVAVRINRTIQKNKFIVPITSQHCNPYNSFLRIRGARSGSGGGLGSTTITSTGRIIVVEPSSAQVLVSATIPTPVRDLISNAKDDANTAYDDMSYDDMSTANTANTEENNSPETEVVIASDTEVTEVTEVLEMSSGMSSGTVVSGPKTTLIKEINLWRAEAAPEQWSDNWLALTRFDAVVVTDSEVASMPLPAITALKRYVECGGNLCVLGNAWTPPKEWNKSYSIDKEGTVYSALFGTVYILDEDVENLKDSAGGVIKAITAFRSKTLENSDRWTNAMQREFRGVMVRWSPTSPGGFFSDTNKMIEELPVTKSVEVPIRLISVLIIVFAIVIGPVNLFVLSMKNRRIWLLWTVPVISLVASGLVLGTTILREGFVRNQSSSSVTVLNQRTGEAVTYGTVGFYSTLTPSTGLVFSSGTDAIYIGDKVTQQFNIITHPGGEQQFSSGWISPRVPAYFGFRKAESRKERLEFNWAEPNPTVSNHLGVDIDTLTVCSPDGKFYNSSGVIAAGEKIELVQINKNSTNSTKKLEELVTMSFNRFDSWAHAPETFGVSVLNNLVPGSYLATFTKEQSPFVDKSLSGAKPFKNITSILGFFD